MVEDVKHFVCSTMSVKHYFPSFSIDVFFPRDPVLDGLKLPVYV